MYRLTEEGTITANDIVNVEELFSTNVWGIKEEVTIKGNTIKVLRIDGYEYISLTDLAKTQNDESPADVVKNWMRNKETLSILGVWEELNNEILN